MDEGEAFIRDAARKRGIDPDKAVTVARMEGGTAPPGLVGKFDTGWSFWPFQLHYAMKGKPGVINPTVGMGEGFTDLTGWQPGAPQAWRDSVRYALNRVKLGGWGPWYGARKAGIVGFDGVDRNHPWDARSEQWDFETGGGSVPTVTFNRDFPATIQDDDWSCAPSSLDWALRSLGRAPGHSYIENLLVRDGIVSKADGLLVGTGGPLAAWIGKKEPADVYYGADGFHGNNEAAVSFDAVASEIGPYPLLIGGHNWGGPNRGHWTGVRGYDRARDVLLLANPAGSGPTFGGQEMTRQQFQQRGPFSLVRVLHNDLLPSSSAPVPSPSPIPDWKGPLRQKLQEAIEILDKAS